MFHEECSFYTGRILAGACSLKRNEGRSSEQASVCEDRCQKLVRSSRQWVGSSDKLLDAVARANLAEARANKVLDASAQANFSSLEQT